MTPLHKASKAYWDAFYTGMMAVGLDPKDRPAFKAKNDTESETMRCMREAMETLRPHWGRPFDDVFPEPIKPRKATLTGNDMAVHSRAKRKFG
jgi:hypothetical protein